MHNIYSVSKFFCVDYYDRILATEKTETQYR